MARVLEIQLKTPGLSSTLNGLQQTVVLLAQIAQLQQQVNAVNVRASLPSPQGAQGGAQLAQAMHALAIVVQNVANRTVVIPQPSSRQSQGGPLALLRQREREMSVARASGSQARIFDAAVNLRRAQMSVDRARDLLNGPSLANRITQAILSTRFGAAGGAVMPLVGRTLAVAGLKGGAAAGVAGGAALIAASLAVATAGVKAFVEGIKTATSSLRDMGAARTISGGTTLQTATLAATGLPAGDIAGLAAQLRSTITTNPMAMSAAGQLGIHTQARPFGNVNEADLLLRAMDALGSMAEGSAKQLNYARKLEVDAYLPLIQAAYRARDAIKADAQVRAAVADQDTLRSARDLSLSVQRLQFNFMSLVQALAKPFLKDAAAGVSTLANIIRSVADALNANPQLARQAVEAIIAPVRMFFNVLFGLARLTIQVTEAIGITKKGTLANFDTGLKAAQTLFEIERKKLDAKNAATVANTQAIQNLTTTIQQGTFGGGDRARGAMPGRLKGYAFQRALEGNALRLGAFNL